jgi:hypothetical protein
MEPCRNRALSTPCLTLLSPKIYQSMSNRDQVSIAISTVAAFVFLLYAVIISLGYLYYGSSTMIPGMSTSPFPCSLTFGSHSQSREGSGGK